MPKQFLYGELERRHPRHGTKRRWRDLTLKDLEAAGIGVTWYEVAQDRLEWVHICRLSWRDVCSKHHQIQIKAYGCPCGCSFRLRGDLTRHSHFCDSSQQHTRVSTFVCLCGRSFHRQGDLSYRTFLIL